jgi:hypothetical protein
MSATNRLVAEETPVETQTESDWITTNLPQIVRLHKTVTPVDPGDSVSISPSGFATTVLLDYLQSDGAASSDKEFRLLTTAISLCALGAYGGKNRRGNARLEAAVQSGIKQLIAVQDKDGCFCMGEQKNGFFHALALLAVCQLTSPSTPELKTSVIRGFELLTERFRSQDGGFGVKPKSEHGDAITTYFSLCASHQAALRFDPNARPAGPVIVGTFSRQTMVEIQDFVKSLGSVDGLYAVSHGVKPSYFGTVANMAINLEFYKVQPHRKVLERLPIPAVPFACTMRYLAAKGELDAHLRELAITGIAAIEERFNEERSSPVLAWSAACYVWILDSMLKE